MTVAMRDTRRNVFFLIPTLTAGGAERVITILLKHLDRSKFRLTLGVVDTRGAVLKNQIPSDVDFIDLCCSRVRYALPKIMVLLWCHRPDVVFSTLGHLNIGLAIMRPFLPAKSKYIVREASIPSYNLRNQPFYKLWESLYSHFYSQVDFLVCQSKSMQRDLVDNFYFPPDKSMVIHNPVDLGWIVNLAKAASNVRRPVKDCIYFVAAGRLSPEKGFVQLVEAVALLRSPNVRLDILGEGPLFGELESLISSLGVNEQIRLVGYQDNPYACFARADAFILSSCYEGFPNAVLEALACGTPVVSTPAPGGVGEILDGIPECLIADSMSAEALANAMRKWIAGPRNRVSDKYLDRFSIKRIVTKYEELLS